MYSPPRARPQKSDVNALLHPGPFGLPNGHTEITPGYAGSYFGGCSHVVPKSHHSMRGGIPVDLQILHRHRATICGFVFRQMQSCCTEIAPKYAGLYFGRRSHVVPRLRHSATPHHSQNTLLRKNWFQHLIGREIWVWEYRISPGRDESPRKGRGVME